MLTVSVRDQGTPARRDYARLVVRVTDENDHSPAFLSDLVVGQVPETAAEGTQVVTVLATDRDHGQNARVTYSIQSGMCVCVCMYVCMYIVCMSLCGNIPLMNGASAGVA